MVDDAAHDTPDAAGVTRLRDRLRDAADHDVHAAQSEGAVTSPRGTPENPSTRVLTAANAITACRLALTVAFLALFVQRQSRGLAVACYTLAAITDFLDGQVARRTQTVSWLGKIMDPVMDRVLLFTGVLGLMLTGELPFWVAAFVIGRDAYLALGSAFLQRYRRRPIDVAMIGKVATALLMFGFCDLLLGVPLLPGLGIVTVPWLPGLNDVPAAAGILFVYAGVVCSAVAAVFYTREGLAVRRAALAAGRRR